MGPDKQELQKAKIEAEKEKALAKFRDICVADDASMLHNQEILKLNKHKGIGRNSKCYCGSGKKYKKCCLPKLMRG